MSETIDIHLEWARTAREELLIRVKHRDGWLKLQLLAQSIIWGLSKGIKLGGVEPINAFPDALFLAFPITVVLAALYYVEDGLIYRLSQFISGIPLSLVECGVSKESIINWDGSRQLQAYASGLTLKLRFFAQLAVFICFPLYLILIGGKMSVAMLICQVVFLAITLTIVIFGYKQRKGTGYLHSKKK